MKKLAALLMMLGLPACTLTKQVQLTPVSGPLARKGITAIPASFTWDGSGAGAVFVTMPNGEYLTGRYSTMVSGVNSYSSGSSMANISAFGTGGYASGVGTSNYFGSTSTYANQQYGKALATGNKGTVLQLKYTSSRNAPTSGQGDGFDNKGNKYTIVC